LLFTVLAARPTGVWRWGYWLAAVLMVAFAGVQIVRAVVGTRPRG
jgi:hypothetical protein